MDVSLSSHENGQSQIDMGLCSRQKGQSRIDLSLFGRENGPSRIDPSVFGHENLSVELRYIQSWKRPKSNWCRFI